MSRINTQSPASLAVLAEINAAFGVVPNMFKTVAASPAALTSMWAAFGALGKSSIGPKLGEQIAITVANINGCEYCLAAHTAIGQKHGVSSAELAAAKLAKSEDPRTAAALAFVAKVVRERAKVSANDVAQLKLAGFSDEAVVEIVAHVALNLFTNYINVALDVPVDFPKVSLAA